MEVASSVKGVAVIASLPIFLFSVKQALEPLYASLPVIAHLSNITLLSALLSAFLPLPAANFTSSLWNESSVLLLTSILLGVAPKTSFYVGAATARWHNVFWGPIATHAVLTAPIVFLEVLLLRLYIVRRQMLSVTTALMKHRPKAFRIHPKYSRFLSCHGYSSNYQKN